jgi:hypothetical protein
MLRLLNIDCYGSVSEGLDLNWSVELRLLFRNRCENVISLLRFRFYSTTSKNDKCILSHFYSYSFTYCRWRLRNLCTIECTLRSPKLLDSGRPYKEYRQPMHFSQRCRNRHSVWVHQFSVVERRCLDGDGDSDTHPRGSSRFHRSLGVRILRASNGEPLSWLWRTLTWNLFPLTARKTNSVQHCCPLFITGANQMRPHVTSEGRRHGVVK